MTSGAMAHLRRPSGNRIPPRIAAPEAAEGDQTGSAAESRQRQAEAPRQASSEPWSYAFAWHGRVYAFGGAWFAFRRPERKAIRKALENSGATHWTKIPGDGATHIGAFRLPGERGRIRCAVEAARIHLGSDFIAAFELSSASLPRAWWVVAVADNAVLLDSVLEDLQAAQSAYQEMFVPGRSFSVQVAPGDFSPNAFQETPLEDFLDLSDLAIRRIAPRKLPALMAVAGMMLLTGGLAAAGLRNESQPPPPAGPDPVTPGYPTVTDPGAFGLSCEAAIAEALLAGPAGWQLESASCADGRSVLGFQGGPSRALQDLYRDAAVAEASGHATASVALNSPVRTLLPGELGVASREDLGKRLSSFGNAPRFELVHAAHEAAPFDSYRFELASREPMPALIQTIAGIPNAEWTEVRFAPDQLQWHVVGLIHVRPE